MVMLEAAEGIRITAVGWGYQVLLFLFIALPVVTFFWCLRLSIKVSRLQQRLDRVAQQGERLSWTEREKNWERVESSRPFSVAEPTSSKP